MAVFLAFVALLFSAVSGSAEEAVPRLRVGVMAPLTGPAASSGRWIMQGIELARAEAGMGDVLVPEVEVQDDLCSSQGGLSAYRALRARGVSLIVGPVCNAAAVPIIPLAQREGVTLIATGVPSRAVLGGGPPVFTVLPPIETLASRIVEFAVGKERSKFAVLYTPDEFGEENYRSFLTEAARYRVQIVHSEQFVPGSMDFKGFILKAREKGADGYLIAAYVGHYMAFLKQAALLGSQIPLFAVPTFQAPEIAALRPPPAFEIFYPYPGGAGNSRAEFLQRRYLETHPEEGNMMPVHVGAGHDAFVLALQAMRSCGGTEAACVRQKLGAVEKFSGANGSITIDGDGNNAAGGALEIRGLIRGTYELVEAGRKIM